MNNNNNILQWITLVLIIFLVIAWGIDSCNKQPATEHDTSKLEALISKKMDSSLSLVKQALDSMQAISIRDSSHNVQITNIFNNSTKKKDEIKNIPFNPAYVSDINRRLDSVFNANR